MTAPIRVAVVDDQSLVVEGFSLILNAADGIEVALQCADGQALVDAVHRGSNLDVALVDIRMPVMDGLEATRRLARVASAPSVIVVTTFDDDAYVLEAIAAGAAGFLLKRCTGRELVDAVRAVAAGDAVLSPGVTQAVLRHVHPSGATAPDLDRFHLTERERDVLALIGDGLNNTEIGEALFLSMSTVKSHVSNVLAKTGSRDRVQAALLAHRASA
ncbi:response regulator transcription factor [Demetria terragena]|uniref:response regulator transcription factor n=1 Tax=Demetria terragena TaxID=63959 RepID=UPI00037FBE4C|nr:response regulator transcription factor [Demetria terragena]